MPPGAGEYEMKAPEVLILFNLPGEGESLGSARFAESDRGILDQVRAVKEALEELRIPHRSAGISRLDEVIGVVTSGREKTVLNLVEALDGSAAGACAVPDLLRALGRRFSGCDTPCLNLTLDKHQAKAVLRASEVATPDWSLLHPGESASRTALPGFPVIVKPTRADASEGIDAAAVVAQPGQPFEEAVRRVHEEFGQPALVEAFVEGREFNVSLLQDGDEVRVLPLAEIEFRDFPAGRPRIVDYAAKWLSESWECRQTVRKVPAELSDDVATEIRAVALRAWKATGCRDYARVDIRMSSAGHPFVLEVNANPDISPDGGFAAALAAGGITYSDFIATLLRNAERRPIHRAVRASSVLGPDRPGIRRTEAGDVEAVLQILKDTGFFRPDEVVTAGEVLEEAVDPDGSGHYRSYCCEADGRVAGWVCWGPTPCTLATFDLYWLAVAPDLQGKGLGKELMSFAESAIAAEGGRIVVVETAGRPDYEPTRRFYERVGYQMEACLADFYAPGDDKVVYYKRLA